jgi:protein SCO1/2
MTKTNIFRITILLFAAIAGAWLSFGLTRPPEQPAVATVLPAPGPLPQFSLLDQDSKPIGPENFEGHWSLMFFGFTHCPDICPATMQILAAVKERLIEHEITPPTIVLVSVDPERDTPEILGDYVSYFGDDNIGITGDMVELKKLTGGLGIFFERSPIDADASTENYSVDHSAVVLVINPRGQFHALFSTPHSTESIANDLRLIMSHP